MRFAEEVGRSAEVIQQLENNSESIGTVLDVIRGFRSRRICWRSNAAIEAARARELGRGFAVVADEVPTLASRTQSSTEKVCAIIQRVQRAAHGDCPLPGLNGAG